MASNLNTKTPDTLACIIVTYNPDRETFSRLITQLLKSSVSIYVVDNWFSGEATEYVLDLCERHVGRITFIPLKKNYGISKAINTGVERAREDKHSLVMLFDQDSVPQDGLLDEMQVVARRVSVSDDQVAAIAPRLYDPRSRVFFKHAVLKWGLWKKIGCDCGNGELMRCEFINSSGSLIFLKHWDRIGPFREDFFIDHVETEWYMRVRHLGLNCYRYCSEAYLEHHMGDDVCRYWLGKWRFMPRRSPLRHYTIIRNGIWMWRMRHVPFAWITNSLMKIGFTLAYFSLFDREKKMQFLYILKGIRDGLFSRPRGSVDIPDNIDPAV
jgi:rhamnosyltransferase